MFQHNHYTHTLIIWPLIQLHRKFRLGSFTTEDEMVGWHHQLNGHESEQALGVADEQGTLACCSPWGRKELDTAEQLNWTELLCVCVCVCVYIHKVKWSESHSVVSDSLWPHGLYSPWNSPGKSTGVGSLFLPQGIFPTQVSHIAGRFFTSWATREAHIQHLKF